MESDFREELIKTARAHYTGSLWVSKIPDEIPGQGGGDPRPFDVLIGYRGRAAMVELKFTHRQSLPWSVVEDHQEKTLMAFAATRQAFSGVMIQWRFAVLPATQKALQKQGVERPTGALVEVWALPIELWVQEHARSLQGSLSFARCTEIGIEIPPIERTRLPDSWTLDRLFEEAPGGVKKGR